MNNQTHLIKHYKLILSGLIVSLLIVAIDSTITTTAMPKIVTSLGGLEYYVWPFTIYLTTVIISAMLSGKLTDFYGSKKVLIVALLIFMAGSVLCGFSQNMTELILFRALQGLGAGIIVTVPKKIVAEMFPPRQRGKYMGLFGIAGGISTVVGPTLGGLITDSIGWQWIFLVNVPIGMVTLSLIVPYLPELGAIVKERVMDYMGITIFTAALTSFLVALTFSQQGSVSPASLYSLWIFSVIMLTAFIYAENKAKEPLLPLYLFKNRVFTVSTVSTFLLGAITLVGTVYIPVFLQFVQDLGPGASGAYLTPLMLSMIITAILSGQIISKTGTYKKLAILSFALGAVGMFFLSTLNPTTSNLELIIFEIITGIGGGLAMPIFMIAAQNAVSKRDLGAVTSSSMYFEQLGSVVGLTILGTIVNMTLKSNLQNTTLNVASPPIVIAIHNVFIAALVMNIIGFLICFFLKDVYMSNEM